MYIDSTQAIVAPELAKPTSLDSTVPTEMITFESECDTGHEQYNSEMNINMSHSECEERYKEIKISMNEMEQKLITKIKELEHHLEAYKSELGRLHKETQVNKSHCHVMIPKRTLCYCYAQVGAHSHYVAESYSEH